MEPAKKNETEAYISGWSGDDNNAEMANPVDGLDLSSLLSPEDRPVARRSPCSLTLYSEEYWTGESLTFSLSLPDLSVWGWQEKLASVRVEGDCRWKIFTGRTLSIFLTAPDT